MKLLTSSIHLGVLLSAVEKRKTDLGLRYKFQDYSTEKYLWMSRSEIKRMGLEVIKCFAQGHLIKADLDKKKLRLGSSQLITGYCPDNKGILTG